MRFKEDNGSHLLGLRFRLAGVMALLFIFASIFPVGAQEVNLALNKPITPHTNIQQGAPEYVVDGEPSTVWYSWQGGFTEISFTVDLTFAANLTSYRFLPRQLTTYRIETSVDGAEWVERAAGALSYGQTSAVEIENSTPQHARYIRFTGSNNQNAFAGVAELEAFGAAITSVDLPQTGQTLCFDAAGEEIDCPGTGQDGEIQAGVAWPQPRFTDNNDGTLTDHLTGLVWLKDAGCANSLVTWNQALSIASQLDDGDCDLTDGSVPGDWRLPNINELESLTNLQAQNLNAWLMVQGFTNVQAQWYWSSTTAFEDNRYALFVDMEDGKIDDDSKENARHFWPVRSAGAGTVALPQTGQTECYNVAGDPISCEGTGQDGEIRAGTAWPEPRFSDNLDGTVTDNLTGMVWLKNATCAGYPWSWQNALAFANGLASGECGLSDGSRAGDWRLPNRKEMLSLLDRSRISPPLPDNHPFTDVLNSHYWTSSTWVNSSLPGRGWYVGFNSNDVYPKLKDQSAYAWPVRAALDRAPFAGGDGSAEDPYQIATAQHLNAVRDYLDKHFILIADIDLMGEWEPIGTYVNWENTANEPFTGSFNGAGFSISGLFIDRPFDLGQDGVGLFGLTLGATIENLNLADVDIAGRTAGALVGWAFATTVKNVTTSGEVTALTRAGGLMGEVFENSQILDSSSSCQVTTTNGTNAGGLIGQMRGTTVVRSHATGQVSTGSQDLAGGLVGEASYSSLIQNSYATGNVTGESEIGGLTGYLAHDSRIENSYATGLVDGGNSWNVGGLVGHIYANSTIARSYASGQVSGGNEVGGLVGSVKDVTSSIMDSFAVGEVTASENVGGLVGKNLGRIEHTYSTGAVITRNGVQTMGGLIGSNEGLAWIGTIVGDVRASYWDTETSGMSNSAAGVGRTKSEMQQFSTFEDWDFLNVWNLVEGHTYPYMVWQKNFVINGTTVQIIEDEGDIKAGYLLTTAGEAALATRVQSTVADENSAGIEGLQGRWMAVTRAGSSEARAVTATDAEGESRTWFEVYNAQTESWERASSTLAQDIDAFEAGNEIVIEEDDTDGLQIRIETQVTRELHF